MRTRRALVLALALASVGCAGLWGFDDLVVGADARAEAAEDAPSAEAGPGEASPDAAPDVGLDAQACLTDLSNVGAGDFHVRFRMATTAMEYMALLNQRGSCDVGVFWEVQTIQGYVIVEVDDGTSDVPLDGRLFAHVHSVADGLPHDVVVARVGGLLSLAVDGQIAGSVADPGVLGTMPPLKLGTSPCVGLNGLTVFVGQLTNVCLTNP